MSLSSSATIITGYIDAPSCDNFVKYCPKIQNLSSYKFPEQLTFQKILFFNCAITKKLIIVDA